MTDLIRTDTVFGKRANIVGNISADLVLESLGKVYIKSRNSAKTLELVIRSIALTDAEDAAAKTIVVEGLENLSVEPKEGQLIYDTLSNILYIWIDGKPIELINVAPEGTGYVKRSGDTMTGRLSIIVPNGPPLAVNSSELVENLNAQYLGGEPKTAFALKRKDELISGRWTFRNIIRFNSNVKFDGDLVIDGSLGTPYFASGFSGYGWRLDADTNTLTVDNLVVRKMLMVYELVVNRVSAVNGSLWVSNSGKVTWASKLPEFNSEFIYNGGTQLNISDFVRTFGDNGWFIYYPNITYRFITPDDRMTASGTISNETIKTISTEARQQALVIHITNLENFIPEIDTNANDLLTYFSTESENFKCYSLFNEDFNHEVVFPIITEKNKLAYDISEEYRLKEKEDLNSISPSGINYLSLAKALANRPDIWTSNDWLKAYDLITNIKSYYKYFATGKYYVATFDDESLPIFKEGDIIRCLKWTHGGIKYYDGVVCNYISDSTYFILLADSIFDKTTVITYDNNLDPEVKTYTEKINTTLYLQTKDYVPPQKDLEMLDSGNMTRWVTTEEQWKEMLLAGILEKDGIVLFGNLWNWQRQNALYLTSVDDHAPYMDVITNVNRPDIGVIYQVPIFRKVKLYKTTANEYAVSPNDPVPYTGEYYELSDENNALYAYGMGGVNEGMLFFDLSKHQVPEYILDVKYLSSVPTINSIGDSGEVPYKIILEDSEQNVPLYILLEDGYDRIRMETGFDLVQITSSKTTKVRLGQLEGIEDPLFEFTKQPHGYGLYADNVYLTGEFILSNGKTVLEISEEGLRFAVASKYAGDNARELLRLDMEYADLRLAEVDAAMLAAHDRLRQDHTLLLNDHDNLQGLHNLLQLDHNQLQANHDALVQRVVYNEGDLRDFKESVYTIDDLKTAGMVISNNNNYPGIIIWGNYIYFATKQAELDGREAPTALFSEGRINAKFIETQDIHSQYYLNDGSGHTMWYYNQSEVYESGGAWYYMNGNFATYDSRQVYEVRDDYAWHLKYRGDGYLAFGNISWTRDGNISLRGNINVSGSDGIYIDASSGDVGVTMNSKEYPSAPDFVDGDRVRTYKCVGNAVASRSDQIIAKVACALPKGYTISVSCNAAVTLKLYNGNIHRYTVANGSSFACNYVITRLEVSANSAGTYNDVVVNFTIPGIGTEIGPDHVYFCADSNHTLWLGRDCFSVMCAAPYGNASGVPSMEGLPNESGLLYGTYGLEIDKTGIYLISKPGYNTAFPNTTGYRGGHNIFDYRRSIFDWFITRDEYTGGGSSTPTLSGGHQYYIIDNVTNIPNHSVSGNTISLESIYSKISTGDTIFIKGYGLYLTITASSSRPIRNASGSGDTTSVGSDKRSRIFLKTGMGWIEFYCE